MRIFGGKPKRRPPAQKRDQQQQQQQEHPPQQQPSQPKTNLPPVTTWQPSIAASTQPTHSQQQATGASATPPITISAETVEESDVEAVLRQIREAIEQAGGKGKDGDAAGSDGDSQREWWTEDQPGMPAAPAAGAAWEDWQEFFVGADMNAVWARHVTDEVEGFLSQDQYDLASKAQQKLDKAIKQDAVQTVVKEFERALKDQDYAKAAYLRDAGGAGLLGWWYAVGEASSTTGGHLLQIVPEPHHGCYAGYMVTASDLCTLEAHQPKSMISGDLGAWHATMAQNQAQQDNPGGGLIIQAQEVQEQGSEPQEPPTIDDFGHPIMELYLAEDAQGKLRQQATALQHTPRNFETDQGVTVLGPDEQQGDSLNRQGELIPENSSDSPDLQMDIQELGHGGTLVSFRVGGLAQSPSPDASSADTPSTSAQGDSSDLSSRSRERTQRLINQLREQLTQIQEQQDRAGGAPDSQSPEQILGMMSEGPDGVSGVIIEGSMVEVVEASDDEDELARPHRMKASLVQLDRNSFKLNVLEERSPDEASSPPSSSSSQPQQQPSAASMHIPDMGLKSKEHVLQNLRSLTENSDGPEFQKLVQRLGKAMHTQDGSISSDHLDSIVRGILLHALQSAMGALSEPVEDPAQEIAVHGLSGSTQYRRVPVEFNTLDPFSGVFLDPFNSKGAELYLLERARGEDGQDSMTAVKITSTENVSAGSVAFRASLAPQKRMPLRGFHDELSLSGRYKAQCRLSNVDSLNARWDDAELLQFSSSASHAADLGLMTGGSGSGHQVAWLKRMHLTPT